MKKGQPYSDSTWEHLFRSAKIFPWLTFNFRLRTGHKSDRSYSATEACYSCRELCYKAQQAQQVAMAVQQCEICKKCSYLVRMLHPSNHQQYPHTWSSLYMIFSNVRYDFGGKVAFLWLIHIILDTFYKWFLINDYLNFLFTLVCN